MDTKKTYAFHYNEAVRDLKRYKPVALSDIKTFILEGAKGFTLSKDSYCQEIDLTPAYNSEVVEHTLNKLSLAMDATADAVLSQVVYNSRRVDRAMKTLVLYGEMEGKGYMPIHDITPEYHGKTALLTGKQSMDWLTTHKKDEKVVLVCVKDEGKEYARIGYRRPRMRTRFYAPQVDADLFIKVIE